MSDLNLGVDFVLNTPQALAEAERVRNGIAAVGTTAVEANARVAASVTAVNQAAAQSATRATSNYNGLQNSINQISRELPAFTYNAQTGFMGIANNIPILIDQIQRLRAENVRLAESGQRGVPVWKQLISGLFSLGTALGIGITLMTVYGKEIGNFFTSLFKGKNAFDGVALGIQSVNKALDGADYKKAISNIAELTVNLELAKKGAYNKDAVLQQYNATLGQTAKSATTLAEVEKGLVDNAEAYIKMTFYKAVAQAKMADSTEKYLEKEKEALEATADYHAAQEKNKKAADLRAKSTVFIPQAKLEVGLRLEKESEEKARKKVAGLMKEQQAIFDFGIKGFNEMQRKAAAEAAKMGGKLGDTEKPGDANKAQSDLANILDGRKGLYEKLRQLDAEYAGKKLSDNEAEKAALKEKFDAFRVLIEKENEKITAYNKKNKTQFGLIPMAALDPIEATANQNLQAKQDVAALKTSIEAQKQIFEQYEQYKLDFGTAKANQKFKTEINGIESYVAYLKTLMPKDTDKSALANQTRDLLATLQTQANKEAKDKAFKLNEELLKQAVAATQTVEEQKQKVREKYHRLAEAMKEDITDADRDRFLALQDEEFRAIEELDAEKLTKFYTSIDKMLDVSKEAVQAQIASIKQLLANSDITAEAKEPLEAQLAAAQKVLKMGEGAARVLQLNQKRTELLAEMQKLIKAGETGTKRDKELKAELDAINAETKNIGLQKLQQNLRLAFEAAGQLGFALDAIGNSLNNDALKNGGALLGGIASQAGNIMTAFDSQASTQDKIAAGINGLITIIDVIATSAAERKKAEEEYYRSVIQLQNDYNISLNDQIRLQSILKEGAFLKDYKGRITDAIKATTDAQAKLTDTMGQLANGRAITGKRNAVNWNNVGKATGGGAAAGAAIGAIVGGPLAPVTAAIGAVIGAAVGFIGGLFGGKKKVDTYLPVLQEYPELIQKMEDGTVRFNVELGKSLVANNLVDDATKGILNNIEAWQKKLDEAREQIKGVVSDLAGSLGDGLRNALVTAFKDGEDAAKAFGDSVNGVLENILSNLLFNAVFNDAFKKLEAEMVKSFDPITGDSNVIDDFGEFFKQMPGLVDLFNQSLEVANQESKKVGLNAFGKKDKKTDTTLAGAIKGITADQAGLLAGQFGAVRIGIIEGNIIAKTNGQSLQEQNKLMREQMMAIANIEKNTKKSADTESEYLPYLKDIAASMGVGNINVQLRAAGK